MSVWNYVVSAHKPTSVSHSCVGNFTSPHEQCLIVAKGTRIEIHKVTPNGELQTVCDLPIYGRITCLDLFRPPGADKDFLFIATEKYKYCVLQWDSDSSELITRAKGDVSDVGRPTDTRQIIAIDPDCRLIGLHLYNRLLKVIPLDAAGLPKEPFNIRLEKWEVLEVLDIKFLYGCTKPTIAVLFQGTSSHHVTTYEVCLKSKRLAHITYKNVDSPHLLIPVPSPMCGVLIIGEEGIDYIVTKLTYVCPENSCTRREHETATLSRPRSITKAYGRAFGDDSKFFLGDDAGQIHQLVLNYEHEKVTALKIKLLGETSIASSISCLNDDVVFVGSSYGDSQLIKLNSQRDAKGSYVGVLENYVNLGPIVDLCVVDLERRGQGEVVTCSGAYKDGSLRIVRNGIEIDEQAAVELEGIKGMWSLKSSTKEAFYRFLVVSFIGETRIFMYKNDEVTETETNIKGFSREVQTLFCHDAVYSQRVQVTSNSVRLVSSKTGKLQCKWDDPAGVNVATANASQVLLATGDRDLVFLKIGDRSLEEVKRLKLDYEVSCLDINPIGGDPNSSQLAAVGMWREISLTIFKLPDLVLVTKKLLGGDIIPRSVLLCAFEGISYVLCALGDGHLLNFQFDTAGELRDREEVLLGTRPITLRTFSSKSGTHVFAASDRPAVIYGNKKGLVHSNVNLKEVSHMCPFSSEASPDGLAIATAGKLTIGTFNDVQKLHVRTIPVGVHVRRISHQEQTRTFAICCLSNQPGAEETKRHFVRLLDDQTFSELSTYPLDASECGCSILSCSCAEAKSVHYCVGTAYVRPDGRETFKGRILVFIVDERRRLQLIAEKETEGPVYSLNAFNGKLLAAIGKKIRLYKWMLRKDGTWELLSECEHDGHEQDLYVQTRGDFIVVGDLMKSISLLNCQPQEGVIKEVARDDNANWMAAVEILGGDDIFLGADICFNLFTVKRNYAGVTDEDRARLEVVGEYHLGEFVNRFRHGSFDMRFPNSETGQIPTIFFGTVNGVIGVMASLPREEYQLLEKLQTSLRKLTKGVGDLSHEEWRSFKNEKRTANARCFLDGDLIESFIGLPRYQMEAISSDMDADVDELYEKVKELTRLY